MSRHLCLRLLGLCVLILLPTGPQLLAQDDECLPFVQSALTTVDEICKGTSRNEACYGNHHIEVETSHGIDISFETPGDLAALADISLLRTSPLDINSAEWGICLMKVQANLPESLPGQSVTFLLLGDVTLRDVSGTGETPMQAFYLRTGFGQTACRSAPSSLVVQSPRDTRVTFNINGVDVNLGSTSVLSVAENERMDILIVEGEGQVTALDESQTVASGEVTSIALGGDSGLTPTSPPAEPEAYAPERIEGIPFFLLPESVWQAQYEMWGCNLYVGTLEPGKVVLVSNGVPHNTWPTAEEAQAYLDSTEIIYTVDGVPHPYHYVGGVKWADFLGGGYMWGAGIDWVATPGTHVISMSYSQCDLAGHGSCSATCTLVVPGEGAQLSPAPAAALTCTVSTTNNVNLRAGPGTSFAVADTLLAGAAASVSGQTTGLDGFVWWRLTNGLWVRSDVVGESGDCADIPLVAAS